MTKPISRETGPTMVFLLENLHFRETFILSSKEMFLFPVPFLCQNVNYIVLCFTIMHCSWQRGRGLDRS